MPKWVLVSTGLVSVLLLSACGSSGTANVLDDGSSSSVSTIDDTNEGAPSDTDQDDAMEASSSSDSGMMDASSSDDSAAVTDPAGARIIEMTATDWEFSPKTILATKGEKVIVRLTGIDGEHSFGIKDLGLNVKISAGETKDIEIPTDTAGTFEFRCMVPCGPGHKDMTGTIVIS